MPRTARKKSCKQIYHIMLRGINKQQIFYEKEDYQFFISILERYKETCGYELYAYCLMGNHIHLLIREGNEVATCFGSPRQAVETDFPELRLRGFCRFGGPAHGYAVVVETFPI